jgi:hypothetical protein
LSWLKDGVWSVLPKFSIIYISIFVFFPNAIKPLGYVYDYVKDVDVTLGNKTTTLGKRK